MSYKFDFKDNAVYGCEDMNGLRSEIMTAGVGPEMSSCMVTAGVEAGTVKILEGSVLFDDGSRIVFENGGEVLPITTGTKQIIYVENDVVNNTIRPVVSGAEPTGDAVVLAEVAANGVITDRRQRRQIRYGGMAQTIVPFSSEEIVEIKKDTPTNSILKTIPLPISVPSMVYLRIWINYERYCELHFFPGSDIVYGHGINEAGGTLGTTSCDGHVFKPRKTNTNKMDYVAALGSSVGTAYTLSATIENTSIVIRLTYMSSSVPSSMNMGLRAEGYCVR